MGVHVVVVAGLGVAGVRWNLARDLSAKAGSVVVLRAA